MPGELVQLRDDRLGTLDGLYVELPPSDDEADEASRGADRGVDPRVADAINFVLSLLRSRRVALPGGPTHGATHEIQRDYAGRLRLVRRRFSAK